MNYDHLMMNCLLRSKLGSWCSGPLAKRSHECSIILYDDNNKLIEYQRLVVVIMMKWKSSGPQINIGSSLCSLTNRTQGSLAQPCLPIAGGVVLFRPAAFSWQDA